MVTGTGEDARAWFGAGFDLIIIGAVIVIVYTMVGGMWAVALTDFIQMTIIIVGLVILMTVVLVDVGGWGAVAPHLPSGTFNMLPPEHTAEQWLNYLRAWTIIGLVDITAQTLFQRAAAAKTADIARRAFLIGGIAYLTFGMIPVLLGIIGSVTMPDIANSEFIIPELAKAHLHLTGEKQSALPDTKDAAGWATFHAAPTQTPHAPLERPDENGA